MKTVKKILIVLAVIVAIPLVLALFVSNEYTVQRSVQINKPRQDVFNYVKYLKNQNSFNVWSRMDPAMKSEFRGEDGTVGFVSAWESNDEHVGKGEQEIKKITEGQSIETELRFIKPFEGLAYASMITEDAGANGTIVKWNFNSKMPYPMNVMLLFMNMDEMLGKDLQQGLDNLKNSLEAPDGVAQQ